MIERSGVVALVVAVAVIAAAGLTVGMERAEDPVTRAQRVIATPVPPPTPPPTPSPPPTPTPEPPPPEPEPTLVPPVEVAPVVVAPEPVPEPPPPPEFDEGVLALQLRLAELGYWMPQAEGVADDGTSHALIAFQKVAGLPRDGIHDEATDAALAEGHRPTPRSAQAGRVAEVDIERQVLFIVEEGQVTWIFDTSTGKPSTATMRGSFHIYREIDGMRVSRLGELWRPKYFKDGLAIHGYPNVPPEPASSGCVRVTYPAIDMLWENNLLPIGTPVLVY